MLIILGKSFRKFKLKVNNVDSQLIASTNCTSVLLNVTYTKYLLIIERLSPINELNHSRFPITKGEEICQYNHLAKGMDSPDEYM